MIRSPPGYAVDLMSGAIALGGYNSSDFKFRSTLTQPLRVCSRGIGNGYITAAQ